MKKSPILFWFRQDLRLADHPALTEATKIGAPLIPVFILDEKAAHNWNYGGASRWWLHHALANLDKNLQAKGSKLILLEGDSLTVLKRLAQKTGAETVFWQRRYEPWATRQEQHITKELERDGITLETRHGHLLLEPVEVQNKSGQPFRVFTPFWRHCIEKLQQNGRPHPLPVPRTWTHPTHWPNSDILDTWKLLPSQPNWAHGLHSTWKVGEKSAHHILQSFIAENLDAYKTARDYPALDSTSRLSPYLAFGQITPLQCWHVIGQAIEQGALTLQGQVQAEAFIRQLGWREFSYHLLYHFPETPAKALYPQYQDFPWDKDYSALPLWQKGKTGYPLIDAGLRQLWQTGWMHNRVRMVVASFLVKHLLLPWQQGADWFWDTLVDADLANNTMGWQWVAGCGADAAPYFRVFNPVTQSKKFDEAGNYIRRYVPELKNLSNKEIHNPSAKAREMCGYPLPLIDLDLGRQRALEAFANMRRPKD